MQNLLYVHIFGERQVVENKDIIEKLKEQEEKAFAVMISEILSLAVKTWDQDAFLVSRSHSLGGERSSVLQCGCHGTYAALKTSSHMHKMFKKLFLGSLCSLVSAVPGLASFSPWSPFPWL